jgi:hypothetical protein
MAEAFNRIPVPVDFSAHSERALRYARLGDEREDDRYDPEHSQQ